MENSRPDGQEQWSSKAEKPDDDPQATDKSLLSGERWQQLFRDMYQRAEVAPDKSDHIERVYETRHERKDVSAKTGLQLGSVVAGALEEDEVSDDSPFDHIPPPQIGSTSPQTGDQSKTSTTKVPAYPSAQSSRSLFSWVIIGLLIAAIIVLLTIIF